MNKYFKSGTIYFSSLFKLNLFVVNVVSKKVFEIWNKREIAYNGSMNNELFIILEYLIFKSWGYMCVWLIITETIL